MIKVSVIVATFNRQRVLCETLFHLLNQTYSSYEIIVVDQTATMSTELRIFLETWKTRIAYYTLPKPNLPAARNFGIDQSSGDVIVFVDDDVVVDSTFIERQLHHYKQRSIGGVTGICVPPGDHDMLEMLQRLQRVHETHPALRDGDVAAVSWLPGCHMSFRRVALVEAGEFDEHFTGCALCEDVDMSIRVRVLGYKLIADTSIRVVHLALHEGGCEIRREVTEEMARERFALASYCWIKHLGTRGCAATVKSLFRAYRTYALSRHSLRLSARTVLARQVAAVTESAKALRHTWRSRTKSRISSGLSLGRDSAGKRAFW